MTQKSIIEAYLKDCNYWVLAGKVRSIQTKYGFIGFRGDRDIRDMVKAGTLEHRINGKFSEVRAKRKVADYSIDGIPPRVAKKVETNQTLF